MATVPTTRTWVAGEVVVASYLNDNVTAVDNWLLAPAICDVRQTVAQTLTTIVWATALFDTEDVDSTGMHSTVTNTSRLTAVYPGWYWTGGQGSFVANATGIRATRWLVNGTVVNSSNIHGAAFATFNGEVTARSKLIYLNVGDYLELGIFQSSGGNLNTYVTAGEQSGASVHWASN